MAKDNLLSTRNKVLESPYGTYEDVKYNMERYDNLVGNIRAQDSSIIDALVKELELLLQILRRQEQEFSSLLNCADAKEALQVLNDKIDKWNHMGGSILLDIETRNKVLDLVIARINDALVIELLQNYIDRHQTEFNAILSEEVQPTLEEAITALFNNKHRFNKNSSLGASLVVVRNQNGYSISETGAKSGLSQSIKRHLLTLIKEDTSGATATQQDIAKAEKILSTQRDQGEITDAIVDLLASLGVSKTAMNYIKPEIENTSGYARYANLFVIQGYLGEVYWNAFMHYLFENKAWVIPVGDVKNIKGKSMAIDMLVNDIGFQIKRWSIKEGIEGEDEFFYHTNTSSMRFGTFLSSRANLMHMEIGSVIARMFGSLSYNKPDKDKGADKEHNGEKSYSSLFKDLVTVEKINFMDLESLFQTRLSNIIGISGMGGLTLSGKQYYNTFWAINDKIVPSSAIIEELIKDIKSSKMSQGVSFKIKSLKDSGGPIWNKIVDFSDNAMANRWNIQYETTFNLTKLLERASQRA